MSLKKSVIGYLESEPKFRERKNKDKGLVNLLMKRYGSLSNVIKSSAISKDTIVAIVQDYASADRAWRQALEHNPELRGSDYDDKEMLEHKKMEELGYNVPPTTP